MSDTRSNLILLRRKGEAVVIGEGENEVVVTVIATNDKRTSLSVLANRNVKIDRQEVRDKGVGQ